MPPKASAKYKNLATLRARDAAVAELQANPKNGVSDGTRKTRIHKLTPVARHFGISQKRLREAYHKANMLIAPHPATVAAYNNRHYSPTNAQEEYLYKQDRARASRVVAAAPSHHAVLECLRAELDAFKTQVETSSASESLTEQDAAALQKANNLRHAAGLAVSQWHTSGETVTTLHHTLDGFVAQAKAMMQAWERKHGFAQPCRGPSALGRPRCCHGRCFHGAGASKDLDMQSPLPTPHREDEHQIAVHDAFSSALKKPSESQTHKAMPLAQLKALSLKTPTKRRSSDAAPHPATKFPRPFYNASPHASSGHHHHLDIFDSFIKNNDDGDAFLGPGTLCTSSDTEGFLLDSNRAQSFPTAKPANRKLDFEALRFKDASLFDEATLDILNDSENFSDEQCVAKRGRAATPALPAMPTGIGIDAGFDLTDILGSPRFDSNHPF